MPINYTTTIAELLQQHNIDLLRMEAGTAKQVVAMMRGLSKEIVQKIGLYDPTQFAAKVKQDKALAQLTGAVRKDINSAYKNLSRHTMKQKAQVAAIQSKTATNTINQAINLELATGKLSGRVLKQLANNTLIDGAPSADWWKEQNRTLRNAFKREMREGMINGETIQDLVRRVRGRRENGFKDGLMSTATHKAQALVRSSTMAVANAARLETYAQNADVIKGVQVLATLDQRTSDICKSLDGQAWSTPDHNRLPGTTASWRGAPPFHWNCRSTLVPVLRSWSDMSGDPEIKKRLLKAEDSKKLKKGWRSSMDGQVSDKITYEEWLKTKPEAFQLQVLGPTKHAMWKEGKLPFSQLIDQSHNPLTIEVIKKNVAAEAAKLAADLKLKAEIEAIKKAAEVKVAAKKIVAQLEEIAYKKGGSGEIPFVELKKLEGVPPAMTEAMFARIQSNIFKKLQLSEVVKTGRPFTAQQKAVFNELPPTLSGILMDEAMVVKKAKDTAKKAAEAKAAKAAEKVAEANAKAVKELAVIKAQKASYAKQGYIKASKTTEWKASSPVERVKLAKALGEAAKVKHLETSTISNFKKSIVQGKSPTVKQAEVFSALDDATKKKVLADIAKKQKKSGVNPGVVKSDAPNMDRLQQTGPQAGSNPGGKFRDMDTGEEWYVKWPGAEDKARNEVLGARLYQAAGIEVPDVYIVTQGDKIGVASRIIKDLAQDATKLKKGVPGVYDGFATDAWLGNWDVVGLEFDNMLVKAGRAVRVDTGGALRYRAQGTLKEGWGTKVDEILTLRDPAVNSKSASVFAKMTDDDIVASVRKVLAVTDDEIKSLVMAHGPKSASLRRELIDTLVARKKYLAKKYPKAVAKPKPARVESLGEATTPAELEKIKHSRATGWARRSDGPDIEDQQILFWEEVTPAGKAATGAQLKLTPKAMTRFEKQLPDQLGAGASKIDITGVEESIVAAVKGIRTASGKRAKDVQRVNAAQDKFDEVQKLLREGVRDGTISQEYFIEFNEAYLLWFDSMRIALKVPTGSPMIFTPPIAGNVPKMRAIPAGKKATTKGPQWTKHSGEYEVKEIKDGHVTATGKMRQFEDKTDHGANVATDAYYETVIDGTRVRYWSKKSFGGTRGKLEVLGTDGPDKVLSVLTELGVPVSRSTALEAEEMYLRKTFFALKKRPLPTTSKDVQKRVDKLARELSDELGVPDIRKFPDYQPHGIRQGFGQGRVTYERPDLDTDDFREFVQERKFFHQSSDVSGTFKKIFEEGGHFGSKADWFRKGKDYTSAGMSPVIDMSRGGGSYVYTRSVPKGLKDTGFQWSGTLAKRADIRIHRGDPYGSIKEGIRKRISAEDGVDVLYRRGGEVLFKDGISLFTNDFQLVVHQHEVKDLISWVKKQGKPYSDGLWPDGRKLEEVIISP